MSIWFRTINENPNEKIMELALAANDDIYIVQIIRFRLIDDSKIYKKIENLSLSFSLNYPAISPKKKK